VTYFTQGPTPASYTFGKREYVRTRKLFLTESATIDASTVPTETPGGATVKILQPGIIMARITGTNTVGPYDASAADGRQLTDNIVGVNDTFLPTELLQGDHQIAVVYAAAVYAAALLELDTTVPLTPAWVAADAARITAMAASESLGLLFR
jgi:hypothetical protein